MYIAYINNIRHKLIVFLLLFGAYQTTISAEVVSKPDTIKPVWFHFQAGSSALERGYMANRESLDALDAILLRSSFIEKTDSLIVSAGASPDGNWDHNKQLAQGRAEAIKAYIAERTPSLDQDKIKAYSSVTSWSELIPLVEADTASPYKTAILAVLSAHTTPAATESQLRRLHSGKAWRYITTHYLPQFRSGDASIVFYYAGKSITLDEAVSANVEELIKQDTVVIAEVVEPEVIKPDTVEVVCVVEQPAVVEQPVVIELLPLPTTKPFIPFIGIKTDLMLWGGVMPNFQMGTWTPNLSAEVYFARRWSAQLGWAYSNWNSYTGGKHLFAVSAFDLEGRYWFKPDNTYSGFFADVHLHFGDYDKQAELTGQTGTFWGAGVGAGYMLSLTDHWGLEAQVRMGYRSANNEHYDIETGHYYLDRKNTDGAFNAQLRLQVVYRFGKPSKK